MNAKSKTEHKKIADLCIKKINESNNKTSNPAILFHNKNNSKTKGLFFSSNDKMSLILNNLLRKFVTMQLLKKSFNQFEKITIKEK